jgi:hypothetical protein
MLGIITILLGIGLLAAGRRLFWLFVGAAGFLAGVQFAQQAWNGPEAVALITGLAAGILFAALAIFLKTIAIGIAGFLAGGSILVGMAGIFGIEGGAATLVIYIVGGILGVILIGYLFDWALITLSSLAGASMIIQSLEPGPVVGRIGFFVLVILGVVFQGSQMRRDRKND